MSTLKAITCSAPYNEGGLGQHFSRVVEKTRQEGELERYYSYKVREEDGHGVVVQTPSSSWLYQKRPFKSSTGWRNYFFSELFDRAAAEALQPGFNAVLGFGGQTLRVFRKAQSLGAERFEMMAANSHVDNVMERHAKAQETYPFNDSWLNARQQKKTRQEYEMADTIYVASEYSRKSFLDRGFCDSAIKRIQFPILDRFAPPESRPDDGVFRVVYIGSLSSAKGTPLLVDAFQALDLPKSQLTLVGGWASRKMKTFMQSRMREDDRIVVKPGDPVPALHKADVCVHPTWEDGLSYAPLEAIACGVPAIVSEDTGMKEYIRVGENGMVVPTGSLDALVEALRLYATTGGRVVTPGSMEVVA